MVCGDRMFSFALDHARQQMARVSIKFIFDSISLFANITIIFVKRFTSMFIFLFILKPVNLYDAADTEQQFFPGSSLVQPYFVVFFPVKALENIASKKLPCNR